MTNHTVFFKILPAIIFTVISGFIIISCDETMEEGVPVISGYRLTTSDSSIASAGFSSTIAIQGTGLQDVQMVRFNSIDIGLNPNYVTATAIIVTIPDSFPMVITNEICLVTASKKMYCFPFMVEVPKPVIINVIGELKVDGNNTLTIIGSGFAEIRKLVMGDTSTVVTGGVQITKFTVNTEYTTCNYVIPKEIKSSDSIILITTEAGTTSARFNLINSFSPIIDRISNEFAGEGEVSRILGKNLGSLINLSIGGKAITDYTPSEKFDYIDFTVPSGLPAAQLTDVYVSNNFGESAYSFMYRDTSGMIIDFESMPPFCWGTDPYINGLDSTEIEGLGMYNHYGFFRGEMPPSWWDQDHMFCMCEDTPYPVFSEPDVISNYAMKFEIDVRTEWFEGGILYVNFMQKNVFNTEKNLVEDGEIFNYRYKPYSADIHFYTDGWLTITIPLTGFEVSSKYQDFDVTKLQNMRFKFYHDGMQPKPVNVDINVDNIRINKIE